MPSSRESYPHGDGTHISCMAGGYFTFEPQGSPGICILYFILYCFLCIQKDADSKLICEYFLSVYIVHHFLADKRSGILYLAMQEAQGLGPL